MLGIESMPAPSVLRKLYGEQGFVVLPGALPEQIRKACLISAEQADQRRSWVKGDDSDQGWDELSINEVFDPSVSLSGIDLRDLVPLGRNTQWINRYRSGQFIAGHKDAAGDAHLLFVIQQPKHAEGGRLWIGSQTNTLPIGEGDAVLFPAAKVMHGMTPMQAPDGASRMTLNVRLWFI